MQNIFTYFPHEKIYHIYLGYEGKMGNCVVDQEGFDIASGYKGTWGIAGGGYAKITSERKTVYLHRLILNAPFYYDVDHKDGNKLNNVISNLQLATESQNTAKSKIQSNNTSGYRGVIWFRARNKWAASIRVDRKLIHLGHYHDKNEAALAYNIAAKKHFGEFAFQNVIK